MAIDVADGDGKLQHFLDRIRWDLWVSLNGHIFLSDEPPEAVDIKDWHNSFSIAYVVLVRTDKGRYNPENTKLPTTLKKEQRF